MNLHVARGSLFLACLMSAHSVFASRAASVAPGSSWCVLAPMEVWNEYDVGFASSLVPIDNTYDQRASSPHILREGSDSPTIVDIPDWKHWSQSMKPGVRVSPSPGMGLVVVDFDTMSTSSDGDVIELRFAPVVLVVDTTAVELGCFYGMTQPCWSPNGRMLAMVKTDTLPSGPKTSRVTSVVVWDASSKALAAFPTPVREVGWRDSIVMVDTGEATFTLDLRSSELKPAAQRGVHVSPDGRYSWGWPSWPAVSGLGVWRQEPKVDLSKEVRGKIGGASIQGRPRPFWVTGGNGHTLCVGVLDAGPGTRRFPSRKPIWRTVFVDVERMKVIRSLSARLVGPTADRSQAVIRRGTHFEFVVPDGD